MAYARFTSLLVWLIAAGLLPGASALAETFKWVDEKGQVHYSDRLPPEAVNRGIVELNRQGMTKKVTAPAPTPEQRIAADERRERERRAELARAERQRQEDALLASYTSESEIDVAKRRNLALIGASILSAEALIKTLQRRTAELDQEKLFYEKKPVPEKLKRELASIAAEIPRQEALIAQKNDEALALIKHYEQQKLRYRELKSRITSEAAAAKKQ